MNVGVVEGVTNAALVFVGISCGEDVTGEGVNTGRSPIVGAGKMVALGVRGTNVMGIAVDGLLTRVNPGIERGVAVGVIDATDINVAVGELVGVNIAIGDKVNITVTEMSGVAEFVGVGVAVGVAEITGVAVGEFIAVAVATSVAVAVGE